MKLTTTKKMVQCLNKANDPSKTNIDHFSRVEMNTDTFQRYVSYDPFRHEIDFDFNTGKFHVIRITYLDDCYACDEYVTTRDLTANYRRYVNSGSQGDVFEFICSEHAI